MILINGSEYTLVDFKDVLEAGVLHLAITVKGELNTGGNNLDIVYQNERIRGIKILPHYDSGKDTTMFLVYVP